MAAAHDRDYKRAAEYLDLRRLPTGLDKSDGPALARSLKIVLDRAGLWVDLDTLSNDPEGDRDDGLPSHRDRVGQIKTQAKTYDILLQRVPRLEGVEIWKFSSSTVAEIPRLYERFGYGFVDDILPAALLDAEFFGIQAWWLVAILVIAFVAYLAALVLSKCVILGVSRTRITVSRDLQRIITGPGQLLVFDLIMSAGINLLV